jgi:hypothetical protein
MNSATDDRSQGKLKEGFNSSRLPGCCAGQALGCGISFIVSWGIALLLSALVTPLFGHPGGNNTTAGLLLTGLTFAGSLILGGGLSFLTGRLFPIFTKKAR